MESERDSVCESFKFTFSEDEFNTDNNLPHSTGLNIIEIEGRIFYQLILSDKFFKEIKGVYKYVGS